MGKQLNELDKGTGYERKSATHDATLTEVGRGKPMGELLRRYWHPVGLVGDASTQPRQVRVLGEDLILFRDGAGRAGLLHARCAHRGTTLYYGKVEDRGIRCCYHGWLFDREGRCLEQPCEPAGGRHKGVIRQPWYPVEERYGLIFAYLGPPDRKPVLPRYDALESLAEGEWIEADDSSIGSGGGGPVIPCNWLQHYENVMDPFHAPVLHGSFSGLQFTETLGILPQVTFRNTPRGIASQQLRSLPDGNVLRRQTEAVLPTLRVVPSPRVGHHGTVESVGWVLPIDDTHFRIYVAGRVREPGALGKMKSTFGGRQWSELSPEEHQRMPGDYEAQVGQGPITLHSEEHLTLTDRGIAMLRQMLRKQLTLLADGGNPINVEFDPAAPPVALEAGNYIDRQPTDA